MSAVAPEADIRRTSTHVCFVPIADMAKKRSCNGLAGYDLEGHKGDPQLAIGGERKYRFCARGRLVKTP